MPGYSDRDLEAFDKLANFGRAGVESPDTYAPGVAADRSRSISYAPGDVEQFLQLMQFGGIPGQPAGSVLPKAELQKSSAGLQRRNASSSTDGGGVRYSDSDLTQFERLMVPSSFSLFEPPSMDGSTSEKARTRTVGNYTSRDVEAFGTLMSLESGAEIVDRLTAEPRKPKTAPGMLARAPVPVRTAIKIVDTDAERTRERHGALGGGMRIKIVYSDAGG